MAPLYVLESVRTLYGGAIALDVPSLALPEGGIVSVVGPNGSGKSTLLSILAFLAPPTSGTVLYRGERVAWRPDRLFPLRREATLLHQSPYLFDATVAANLAFGLRARGIPRGAAEERIAKALAAVGLDGFGNRRARALSGGEAQRVALARALALAPRVLLLDEPFSGVDRDSAGRLEEAIAALPGRGTTVIVTKHDLSRPPRVEGPVVRLDAGLLLTGPHPM